MAAGGSTKAVVAALLANSGIAVAKFIGFLITRSSSMLAESIHSVADAGNQALLLWGARVGSRPADEERPFGYGRERYFWSFVVALVLFTLGSLFSLYEGYEKLAHPEGVDNLNVAIAILVVAIILEAFSFRTAIVEALPFKGQQSWWRYIRTSRSPELPVVLLEDLGAQVGLIIALAGVLLTAATGDVVWDAIATLGIGALLGVIAIILAVEMKSLLIGETAVKPVRSALHRVMTSDPAVRHLLHMRTIHVGPEELFVGAKLELDADLDFRGVAVVINRIEDAIRAAVPEAKIVYLEPDVGVTART